MSAVHVAVIVLAGFAAGAIDWRTEKAIGAQKVLPLALAVVALLGRPHPPDRNRK